MRICLVKFAVLALLFLESCSMYKQDILFKTDKETDKILKERALSVKTGRNYVIGKNDLIEFRIFTNKGEFIIDPTSELSKQVTSSGVGQNQTRYLVQGDGRVNLPILGKVKVDSLTLDQFDSTMSIMYGKYYQDVYVLSKVANRRITIMGTGASNLVGGVGGARAQIIELENENTSLLEVLAKAGGVGSYGRAQRIKVIRGDLSNPLIFTVDITNLQVFQQNNLIMQPNDVIYIEPLRRNSIEFVRDVTQFTGLIGFALSLFILTRL
jgi:polysaccharide biosynthesis/export protein